MVNQTGVLMDYDYCPFCNKKGYGNHYITDKNGYDEIGFMCNDCYDKTYGVYDCEENGYGSLRNNRIIMLDR